jgi:hypothetical protein
MLVGHRRAEQSAGDSADHCSDRAAEHEALDRARDRADDLAIVLDGVPRFLNVGLRYEDARQAHLLAKGARHRHAIFPTGGRQIVEPRTVLRAEPRQQIGRTQVDQERPDLRRDRRGQRRRCGGCGDRSHQSGAFTLAAALRLSRPGTLSNPPYRGSCPHAVQPLQPPELALRFVQPGVIE